VIANITCLIKACEKLGVSYKVLHPDQNVVQVSENPKLIFANRHTPFNLDSQSLIAKDKGFQYELLKNTVDMPKTLSYFQGDHSLESIVEDIQSNFDLPVIVKKNRGSCGCNVFLCKNKEEIHSALVKIFDEQTKDYDYVCLAQAKIDIKREFRVVVWQGKVKLVYEKVVEDWYDNFEVMSPLHKINAYAKRIEQNDKDLWQNLETFSEAVFQKFPIAWTGMDIAMNRQGQWFLIELNSAPAFDIFCKFCGDEPVVELFEKTLRDIL
jgi:glutathione synthase/RimK-type ligase-like ATP-grasp enzyme